MSAPRISHAVTATPSRWARARNWLYRALIAELRVYSSIGRAIARKPAIARDATGISLT
ncbi:MAG: hypothetical protein ACTH8F_04490 [Microbacterium sp.]|uniref:hypothetical protein n=1 Tax=Microbacterium sp. TaxID=51671 RepID=UPI003F983DC4